MQIDSLIPGGHYQFRVRASNRWGVGPPSEPSNMVTLASSSKSHVLLTKKSKCMRIHSRIPFGILEWIPRGVNEVNEEGCLLESGQAGEPQVSPDSTDP